MTNTDASGATPPPPPPDPSTGADASGPPSRSRSRWLIVAALIAIVTVIVAVVAVNGGSDSKTKKSTHKASGGEIFLQDASETGPDPFTAPAANPAPRSTVPADTPVTLGPPNANGSAPTAPVFPTSPATTSNASGAVAITTRSGATPGLYGGTMNQSSCDKQQMIDFLAANPAKARAWAGVEGIAVGDVSSYINGLTPVLLRSDTRVTNHGFVNGHATAHQYVLQAGTAVLVDHFGVPRARCACGNPLLPPKAVSTTPSYQGTPWSGFSPGNVTFINPSTTVINVITIIDVTNGQPFGRPTGPPGGPDQPLPGPTTAPTTTTPASSTTAAPTTTRPTPTTALPTTTTAPATTTTTGPSGVFTLVDAQQTVGELVANWTVNARGGTAKLSIPAGDANYSWTVPPTIDPAGTKIDWGGASTPGANININIAPRGDGLVFDSSDLTVDVTGTEGRKSAVITVPTAVNEVKLVYGMGFSVTVTYTYRR